jgi:carboxylesterase
VAVDTSSTPAPAAPPAHAAGPVPAADKSTPAVFLIHGLGGTQYDLGSMHKRLKNAGFVTHSLTLPGHGTSPEDLVNVTAEDWMEAVTTKYHEVAALHDNFHIMGMCMGALLATELAKRQKHTRGKLIALAPPIYIDGWATAWYTPLRHLIYYVPGVQVRMKVEEEDPFGIKNEQLRAIVKAKFARGENFHYRWVPLACVRQVDRLRGWVMTGLKDMASETLVIHAREDELTSLNSANYLVEQIGGAKARMVVLENSYHMICVDNDREQVARNVLEFFGASSAASLGMAVDDPKMSADALTRLRKSCAPRSKPATSPASLPGARPTWRGSSPAPTAPAASIAATKACRPCCPGPLRCALLRLGSRCLTPVWPCCPPH